MLLMRIFAAHVGFIGEQARERWCNIYRAKNTFNEMLTSINILTVFLYRIYKTREFIKGGQFFSRRLFTTHFFLFSIGSRFPYFSHFFTNSRQKV